MAPIHVTLSLARTSSSSQRQMIKWVSSSRLQFCVWQWLQFNCTLISHSPWLSMAKKSNVHTHKCMEYQETQHEKQTVRKGDQSICNQYSIFFDVPIICIFLIKSISMNFQQEQMCLCWLEICWQKFCKASLWPETVIHCCWIQIMTYRRSSLVPCE